MNCRDDCSDKQQSCGHVKLCQPKSSNCWSKNNNGNENNSSDILIMVMIKKTKYVKIDWKTKHELK